MTCVRSSTASSETEKLMCPSLSTVCALYGSATPSAALSHCLPALGGCAVGLPCTGLTVGGVMASHRGAGGADLARRADGAGGDALGAGAVGEPSAGLERAARRAGDRAGRRDTPAVAAQRHAPAHAVAVLVDLELGLEAAIVGLDLELGR